MDRTKILKPKEEIPQPVKLLEEVPVAPVESKLELSTATQPKIEKKLKWWQRILRFLRLKNY